LVGWDVTAADPIGKPATELGGVGPLGPNARQFLTCPEDDELTHLDAVGPELLAQLVESRLDGRRLGDCVTAAFGRHGRKCITGVTPTMVVCFMVERQ
jgi:hypothetical protein